MGACEQRLAGLLAEAARKIVAFGATWRGAERVARIGADQNFFHFMSPLLRRASALKWRVMSWESSARLSRPKSCQRAPGDHGRKKHLERLARAGAAFEQVEKAGFVPGALDGFARSKQDYGSKPFRARLRP